MDYQGLIEGSRFRSFANMIEEYLYLADRIGASPTSTVNAIMDIWRGRMKDWDWDVQEFQKVLSNSI